MKKIFPEEYKQIKEIEEYYHCQIDELPLNLVINS
jgi:hypothetical protein